MNYRLLIFVSFILVMMTCSSSPEMQKSPFSFKETYQGIELLENGNPVFFYQRKPESLKGQYICTNYSLIAPRPLECQNGLKEPANDFTVTLANEALKGIRVIYTDYNQPENAILIAHQGAHEIDLPSLLTFFDKHLKSKK